MGRKVPVKDTATCSRTLARSVGTGVFQPAVPPSTAPCQPSQMSHGFTPERLSMPAGVFRSVLSPSPRCERAMNSRSGTA